jgi:hypothetical protein
MSLTPHPTPLGPDYAAALLKLRKWRTLLALVVILVLLTQIVLFFLYKYDVLALSDAAPATTEAVETTAVVATGDPTEFASAELNATGRLLRFLMSLGVFVATVFAFMLAIVGLAQALVLVADRRLGVAHSLSGFGWALLAAFVIMPWQIFFHDAVYEVGEFAVPGALWLTSELWAYGKFGDDWGALDTYLRFGRFVLWPLFGIVLVAVAMTKIGRPTKDPTDRDDDGIADVDEQHYAETTVVGGSGSDVVVTDR